MPTIFHHQYLLLNYGEVITWNEIKTFSRSWKKWPQTQYISVPLLPDCGIKYSYLIVPINFKSSPITDFGTAANKPLSQIKLNHSLYQALNIENKIVLWFSRVENVKITQKFDMRTLNMQCQLIMTEKQNCIQFLFFSISEPVGRD